MQNKGFNELNNEPIELNKIWLITGITGQDGSWLAEYLLELGYINIHGIIRRSSTFNTQNIDHIFHKLTLHRGDLLDGANILDIITNVKPHYIVNFAAQSHVKVGSCMEQYTFQVNTLGILHILQTVKYLSNLYPEIKNCRIYQASTSEMFGNQTNGELLLNEETPMNPVSAYGISKLAAHNICEMYKRAFDMFIVSSVLFNHESSRRGRTFVTQKIAHYVSNYNKCNNEPLYLGNLDARRDWGDARDYVKGVYLMLKNSKPKNYVMATGETHSVREFVELAFKEIDIEIMWIGTGENEIGVMSTNQDIILVKVDPIYRREVEIDCLIGDASKIKNELGWEFKTTFCELVKSMVNNAK